MTPAYSRNQPCTLAYMTSEPVAEKRCKTCGQVKPVTDFYRGTGYPDGYRARCKACCGKDTRTRRAENHDVALERDARYREENRELIRERGLRWWRENKDQQAEYQRRYSSELLAEVLAHYGTTCACCGSTDWPTIDHINGDGGEHRRELFGTDKAAGRQFYRWLIRNGFPDGYQTLCFPCNSSKGRTGGCRKDHSRDGDQVAG